MSTQTVLLLTPSPTIAAIFEAAATVLQCRIKHLHTAAEAMAYLQVQQVALIVVDQDISEQSSIALLKDMNSLHPNGKRALILNAKAEMNQVVSALNQAQVSLIFRKPLVDPRMVIKVLRDTLQDQIPPPSPMPRPQAPHPFHALPIEKTQKLERLYTLGEIANGVIHQFNNVLTIMNGHLELLLSELDDPKLQNRALTILKAGEDGARLTRTIQNFVRTSKNPNQIFDLNDIVAETVEMTEPVWGKNTSENPIKIDVQLNDIPLLKGNPGEIREALTNLILNAIDAMPQGGHITLLTTNIKNAIQLRVVDTGIGMADSVQKHIFEPFFTTKGERGNGLGLGIVSRIIRNHGGDIRVASKPGQGTCFTLTFQVEQTHNNTSNTPKTATAV